MDEFLGMLGGCILLVTLIGGGFFAAFAAIQFVVWCIDEIKYNRCVSGPWDTTLNSMMDSGLPVVFHYGTKISLGGTYVSLDNDYFGQDYEKGLSPSRATQKRLRDYAQRSYCIEILKKAEQEQERHHGN